jgi:hypothetical protein
MNDRPNRDVDPGPIGGLIATLLALIILFLI